MRMEEEYDIETLYSYSVQMSTDTRHCPFEVPQQQKQQQQL